MIDWFLKTKQSVLLQPFESKMAKIQMDFFQPPPPKGDASAQKATVDPGPSHPSWPTWPTLRLRLRPSDLLRRWGGAPVPDSTAKPPLQNSEHPRPVFFLRFFITKFRSYRLRHPSPTDLAAAQQVRPAARLGAPVPAAMALGDGRRGASPRGCGRAPPRLRCGGATEGGRRSRCCPCVMGPQMCPSAPPPQRVENGLIRGGGTQR